MFDFLNNLKKKVMAETIEFKPEKSKSFNLEKLHRENQDRIQNRIQKKREGKHLSGDYNIDLKASYGKSLELCKTQEEADHLESVLSSGNFKTDRWRG